MQQYQCHKKVKAAKIESIRDGRDLTTTGQVLIEFVNPDDKAVAVSHEWVAKHRPRLGGYVVVYEDGYMSFSPAKAFEEGYLPIDFDRQKAVDFIFEQEKNGYKRYYQVPPSLLVPEALKVELDAAENWAELPADPARAEAIVYLEQAIAEGYTPSQFDSTLTMHPHLLSSLTTGFLLSERGRAWEWYNMGCNDLLDKGLVNAAPVVQVDGESFEMGGVKYEGNSRAATFEAVTRPVVKWLNDNAHPHSSVVIDQTSAALSAEEIVYGTNDFLKD